MVPDSVVRGLMLVGREPAKMRPSKDLTTCGRVCAVSSRVVVGSGGLSAWTVRHSERPASGCPGLLPGTPGDPARRGGSQGAAQQKILPLLERVVYSGGPVRSAPHPGDSAPSSGCSGRTATMMPAGPLPPECHAEQLFELPARGAGLPRLSWSSGA